MIWQNWKNNKTLQFAVGVTVLIIAVRLVVSGTVLAAYEAMQPAEDGQTKSVSVLGVLWPIVFESICWIGASAITYAIGGWRLLAGQLSKLFPDKNAQPNAAQSTASPAGDQTNITLELGRAAARGDTAEVNRLKALHRRPYAMRELVAAYEAEDLDAAAKLTAELNTLIGGRKPLASTATPAAKPATRKRRRA